MGSVVHPSVRRRGAVHFASLALAGLLGLTGCPSPKTAPPPVVDEGDTGADLLPLLQKDGQKRFRVKGSYKATRPGAEGLLVSAKLDLVAQKPGQLMIAVRSFFEQPVQVIASDGETLTVYDALSTGSPRYLRGPATANTVGRFLPLPLTPTEVVHLILGALVPTASIVDARTVGDAVTLLLERDDASRVVVVASREKVAITEQRFCPAGTLLDDDAAKCPVRVQLRDFTEHAGLYYAQRLEVDALVDGKSERLILDAKDVQYNGPPEDAALFVVTPPEGTDYLPL